MKKTTYTLLAIGTVATLLTSCIKENPDSPGFEYFPDMYRSQSYETNGARTGDSIYVNGMWLKDTSIMANMLAPEGAIPRGFTPFPYANDAAGDSLAAAFWKSPLQVSDAVEEKGKRVYELNCIYCHGAKGDGNGKLVESGKYGSTPPSYLTRYTEHNLSDGHVYHVITYGKGNMGSHASQLTPLERWEVIAYVQRLGRGGKSYSEMLAAPPVADSAKADTAAKTVVVKKP